MCASPLASAGLSWRSLLPDGKQVPENRKAPAAASGLSTSTYSHDKHSVPLFLSGPLETPSDLGGNDWKNWPRVAPNGVDSARTSFYGVLNFDETGKLTVDIMVDQFDVPQRRPPPAEEDSTPAGEEVEEEFGEEKGAAIQDLLAVSAKTVDGDAILAGGVSEEKGGEHPSSGESDSSDPKNKEDHHPSSDSAVDEPVPDPTAIFSRTPPQYWVNDGDLDCVDIPRPNVIADKKGYKPPSGRKACGWRSDSVALGGKKNIARFLELASRAAALQTKEGKLRPLARLHLQAEYDRKHTGKRYKKQWYRSKSGADQSGNGKEDWLKTWWK